MPTKKYNSIADFLDSLDENKREQVEFLRYLITSLDPYLEEHIKWNAPSYVLDDEDRITFNVINKEGVVKLVIHMGALRKEDRDGRPVLADDGGIVQWASDIRGMITFESLVDVRAKEAVLRKVLADWLKISH